MSYFLWLLFSFVLKMGEIAAELYADGNGPVEKERNVDTGERRLNDVCELMKEDDKVWSLDLDGSRDPSSLINWREGRINSDRCSHVGSWGLTFVAVLI